MQNSSETKQIVMVHLYYATTCIDSALPGNMLMMVNDVRTDNKRFLFYARQLSFLKDKLSSMYVQSSSETVYGIIFTLAEKMF